jgi:hypothetical protein
LDVMSAGGVYVLRTGASAGHRSCEQCRLVRRIRDILAPVHPSQAR